ASASRHRRIGVLPDFHQAAVSEIPYTHLCLLVPGRSVLRVDFNMLIIVWTMHIIDPSVSWFDGVERVLGTARERLVIRVNSADFENPGWRTIVSFDLGWTAALPNDLAASPSQSVLADEHLH